MWDSKDCRLFWANIKDSDEYFANKPSLYAQKNRKSVLLLHDFWKDYVSKDDLILELGCNAGGNLNRLDELGYKALSGIEINKTALEVFKQYHPIVYSKAPTINGSLEEVLPLLPSKSVDVVFSMAVLMHIHPSSKEIFRHMQRIASKYILTFEDEASSNEYVFPRNYRLTFNKIGARQIKSKRIKGVYNYENFVLRLFKTCL